MMCSQMIIEGGLIPDLSPRVGNGEATLLTCKCIV